MFFTEDASGGHLNVRAWSSTVNDSDLRLSVISFVEKRMGWENKRNGLLQKGKDTAEADAALQELTRLEADFAQRTIPIDIEVATEWLGFSA